MVCYSKFEKTIAGADKTMSKTKDVEYFLGTSLAGFFGGAALFTNQPLKGIFIISMFVIPIIILFLAKKINTLK